MVKAGMVLGRCIAMVAGSYGDGVAVDGECEDAAGKEHCRGGWRSGDGVAVDGECEDATGKEHCHGRWKLRRWSCGRW